MAKKENKTLLHPRNRANGRYDFGKLTSAHSKLREYVIENEFGDLSIDFFNPLAVKSLNHALLTLHYGIEFWEFPKNTLTPPIPGRADYIHYLADIVGTSPNLHCLDIGVGASCIYPIIGSQEYGWSFVGSDISLKSLEYAGEIVRQNQQLHGAIELRHQPNKESIFKGVIKSDDRFDITLCNPPFHSSAQSAKRGSLRKLHNLKGKREVKTSLNFAGNPNELWCEGGELGFISRMISESVDYKNQCRWFTSLVSNEDNLTPLRRELRRRGAKVIKVIDMLQGNKRSRILAWQYK
ncbi:MAG: 23S rRNA (adenine(1618)-N(6))-methyltransferase RlmF [Rikenellaceae bacterium]